MTYRTAGRIAKPRKATTRKTTKTSRTAKPTRATKSRTTKTRTPKPGQTFSVPVGRKGTTQSAWYFGR